MLVAGSVQRVGQFASREVGIAASHEHQIASQASVLVQSTACLSRGTEIVDGTNQCLCCGRSDALGVCGWVEQLVCILRILEVAVFLGNMFNIPENPYEVCLA